MRILIADDSKAMRMIVARTLRQAGFSGHEIVEATNGQEAFDALAESNPSLVLSDWNMPEMSGYDLLVKIRAAGIAVPFGFITSENSAEVRERALAAGAMFVIAKPFTADDFYDVLEPVLA